MDTTIVGVDITAFGPFSRNLAPESSLDEWTAEAFRDAVEDASLAKNGVCRVLRLTGVAGAPLLVGRDDAMGVLGMQPSP